MLDAWIIEELRRIEQEQLEYEQPFLELPLPIEDDEEEIIKEPERGVIRIQL